VQYRPILHGYIIGIYMRSGERGGRKVGAEEEGKRGGTGERKEV